MVILFIKNTPLATSPAIKMKEKANAFFFLSSFFPYPLLTFLMIFTKKRRGLPLP
jgi:hypothetical protein